MPELYLADPHTVRVANADGDSIAALQDALAHAAVGGGADHLDLPVAGADTWLWWFATPEAGTWTWEARLLERLDAAADRDADREAAFAAGPEAQAAWPDGVDLAALGVTRELTDAQHRDVARMIHLGGGANFSVPGAGKTTMGYVTWAVLRAQGRIDRCMVVAPLSAHESWQIEPVEVFEPWARPEIVIRPTSPHGDIVVVNYERLESPAMLERFRSWCAAGRTLVIFDEAHRAKAGTAGVRGAAALTLARVAAQRAVLTGTPRPNDARDLVNVLELAYPGRGASLAGAGPGQLQSAYCRITKSELDLPALVPRTERVPMSAAHDRVYEAMVDAAARAALTDPSLASNLQRAGRIAMLLLQAATDPTAVLDVSGHLRMVGDRDDLSLEELIRDLPASFVPTKFVRVAQLVAGHQAAGTKVVVWACFRHHVTQLQRLLAPYQPAIVDGSLKVKDPAAPTDRNREIARFRDDPACTALVATPHTLAEGVSLHHTTTHQIHLDRTFNAGMFLQSLDRTHRLGLPVNADCTVTYLVAQRAEGANTIDAIVASRLNTKVVAMSHILDDPGLADLALPSLDDDLTPTEVLLDAGGAGDLAALFAHLVDARR